MVVAEDEHDSENNKGGAGVWRLPVGFLVGTLSVMALEVVLSLAPGGWLQAPSSIAGAIVVTGGLVAWVVVVVGIGALCGWIAGRLEAIVASLSGVAGIIATLTLIPPQVLADAGLGAIITSVPLIGLLALGSSLAFFHRRPDLY